MYSCKPIRKILALIVITLFLSLSATSYAAVAVPDVAATDAAGVERAKAGMALYVNEALLNAAGQVAANTGKRGNPVPRTGADAIDLCL